MVEGKTLYGYPVVVADVMGGKKPEVAFGPPGAIWVFPCFICNEQGTSRTATFQEPGKEDRKVFLCESCVTKLQGTR